MATPSSEPQLGLSLAPPAARPRGTSAAERQAGTTCTATPSVLSLELRGEVERDARARVDVLQGLNETVLRLPASWPTSASWQDLAARGDAPGGRAGTAADIPQQGKGGTGDISRHGISPSESLNASLTAIASSVVSAEGKAAVAQHMHLKAAEMRAAQTSALASLLQRSDIWEAARDLPSITAQLRQHEDAASGVPLVLGARDDVPAFLQQIQRIQQLQQIQQIQQIQQLQQILRVQARDPSPLTSPATAGVPPVYPGLRLQSSGSDASEGLLTTCPHTPGAPPQSAAQGPAPGVPNAGSGRPNGASESRVERARLIASQVSGETQWGMNPEPNQRGGGSMLAGIVQSLASGAPSGRQLDLLMTQLRVLHQLQTQGSSSLPAAGRSPPRAPAPAPALHPASAFAAPPASVPSLGSESIPALAPAPAPAAGLTPAALEAASGQLLSSIKRELQEGGQGGGLSGVRPGSSGGAKLRSGWDQRLELNEHPAEQDTLEATRLLGPQTGHPEEQPMGQPEGEPMCVAEVRREGSCSPRESDSQGREKRGRAKNAEISGDRGDGDEAGLGREQKKLRLSREEQKMLDQTFQRQPRPSQREKEGIARELHATIRQVEVWFQNRRARSKIKESAKELEALRLRYEGLERQNKKLGAELAKALKGQTCRNCMHLE